jgi:integrase/recombinase XerD
VNRKLAALTSFCEFHARHGVPLAGLLVGLTPPGKGRSSAASYKPFLHHVTKCYPNRRRTIKLAASPPRAQVLTAEQVQAILDACVHLRDRLLFALLLDTGGLGKPSGYGTRTWISPSGRSPSRRGRTLTVPASSRAGPG